MVAVKRYELNDEHWVKIAPPRLPGKAADPGRTGSDNRLFVNGCLWVPRSGAPPGGLLTAPSGSGSSVSCRLMAAPAGVPWPLADRPPALQPPAPCGRAGAGVRDADRDNRYLPP